MAYLGCKAIYTPGSNSLYRDYFNNTGNNGTMMKRYPDRPSTPIQPSLVHISERLPHAAGGGVQLRTSMAHAIGPRCLQMSSEFASVRGKKPGLAIFGSQPSRCDRNTCYPAVVSLNWIILPLAYKVPRPHPVYELPGSSEIPTSLPLFGFVVSRKV